jgi:hypothetical protein
VPAVLADLQELFQATVLEANAMPEASHQMISNPLQKHEPNKPGIVGKLTGSGTHLQFLVTML